MDNGNLDNIVFVLLFSADEPLTMRKLSTILDDTPAAEIREAIERWRIRLDEEAWSIVIERVAGGYQLSSRPEYSAHIARLYSGRRKMRLSRAALETLAIIAYKQPITRAEIENVRGVACGGVITNLMERGLIKITGKARVLGAPFLYGSTHEFLEYLGLNSLKDLPSMEELEALLEKEESAVAEQVSQDPAGAVLAELAEAVDEEVIPEAPVTETGIPESDSEAPVLDGPETSGEPVTGPVPEEEIRVETAAARIGPDVEEPYHRPLGGTEDTPLHITTEVNESPGESDEHSTAEEEPQVPPEPDDRNE